jgi:hypothetical protein
MLLQPIPVTARSKLWVCGRSLAWIVVSNPAGRHGCLSLVSVVCCQVEVSATGCSLVQRSPTEYGVSECDREASIMRRPWPTRGCCTIEKKYLATKFLYFTDMLSCTCWALRMVPRSIPDRTTVCYKINQLCVSCVPCAKNSANVMSGIMQTLILFEGSFNTINSVFRIP